MEAQKAKDAEQWYHSESGSVDLSDQRSHVKGLEGKEIYTDYGHAVRARADSGEDIFLWSAAYMHRKGQFVVNADLVQTFFIWGTYSPDEKKRMHAGNFINRGQDLQDYFQPGDLKVIEEADKVSWALGGREFIGAPPNWRIKGDHAGVACDITMAAMSPALWQFGRFSDLKGEGSSGYEQHCTAEGTIRFQGRELKIKGYGNQEHVLFVGDTPRQVEAMSGKGISWAHGFGPEFQWYIMNGDAGKSALSRVLIEGREILCADAKQTWAEEIAYWHDPLSNMKVPYKWHIWMRTPKGVLDVIMSAYGRAYYVWVREGGTIVVYWYMADADGAFTFPDGRVVRSESMMCLLENMKTFQRRS